MEPRLYGYCRISRTKQSITRQIRNIREKYPDALSRNIELTGGDVDYILDGVNKYLMALARKQIRLAFEQSEKEVMDLRQRTREGLETARLAGRQLGRPRGSSRGESEKAAVVKAAIRKHAKEYGGALTTPELIKLTGVSRNTFYKYKREMEEDDS